MSTEPEMENPGEPQDVQETEDWDEDFAEELLDDPDLCADLGEDGHLDDGEHDAD